MLADFHYFDLLHTVTGGRAAVTPVHLLDSVTAREEGESPATSSLSASSHQDTPGPSAGSKQEEDTPGLSISSPPAMPGPSTSSRPATPRPSISSRPATPGPLTSIRPPSPCNVEDDILVPPQKGKE